MGSFKEEEKSLKQFFKFTKDHFKKYPDARIYHYASYEITALEKLTSYHKIHNIDYDHYLHLGKFVDLFRITKQAILVSENSYSIKNLEKFYNFKREGMFKKEISPNNIISSGWRLKTTNYLRSFNFITCKIANQLMNSDNGYFQ